MSRVSHNCRSSVYSKFLSHNHPSMLVKVHAVRTYHCHLSSTLTVPSPVITVSTNPANVPLHVGTFIDLVCSISISDGVDVPVNTAIQWERPNRTIISSDGDYEISSINQFSELSTHKTASTGSRQRSLTITFAVNCALERVDPFLASVVDTFQTELMVPPDKVTLQTKETLFPATNAAPFGSTSS